MGSPINIPAILIANAMGLAILFVVAVGNSWRFKNESQENRCLTRMILASAINCVADPLCFLADGRSGMLARSLVIGCNTVLYIGGVVISINWIYLVASRLKVKLHPRHKQILHFLFGAVLLLLLINLFVPVLFYVDGRNIYERRGGYWFYNACYVGFMLDGFVLYLRQKHTSGGLKFFPVWAFVVPAAFGIGLQVAFYGISTSTPFITVSLGGMILCMQNEFMLRDKLTGLYNRFYLRTVERRLLRDPKLKYSAIMLDINGFKKINDTCGHAVGDEALIQLSAILTEAVGKYGEVVRYAGDEFIIILNSQEEARLTGMVNRIRELVGKFNREKNKPYLLSVAAGSCKLDLKENSMDVYMDKIDELMYENKQEYYQTHSRYEPHKNEHGAAPAP